MVEEVEGGQDKGTEDLEDMAVVERDMDHWGHKAVVEQRDTGQDKVVVVVWEYMDYFLVLGTGGTVQVVWDRELDQDQVLGPDMVVVGQQQAEAMDWEDLELGRVGWDSNCWWDMRSVVVAAG